MPQYEWNPDTQSVQIVPDSYAYRSKWACFSCRTSFTRIRPTPEADEVICPNCQTPATDMGYLFEAPPKRNLRAWKIMETVAQRGFRFHTAGNVAFIKAFILNEGKSTLGEVKQNLDFYVNRAKG